MLIGIETVAGTKAGNRIPIGDLRRPLDGLDVCRLGADGSGNVLPRVVRLILKVGLLRLRNAGTLGSIASTTDNIVSDVLEFCNNLIMLVVIPQVAIVGNGHSAGGNQRSEIS